MCPFCFREWTDGQAIIASYKAFIESIFNKKREKIQNYKGLVSSFETTLKRLNDFINNTSASVHGEGTKYQVSTIEYKPVPIISSLRNEVEELFDKKYASMDQTLTIKMALNSYVQHYFNAFSAVDSIIKEIKTAIEQIRSRRIAANKRISEHLMYDLWESNVALRSDYDSISKDYNAIQKQIEELEQGLSNQNTVNTVFNSLIHFIGLPEYSINNENKLVLVLNKEYDISNEGKRISAAQRKMLSLCYYFAEIIGELKSEKELKNFILCFDDPVDSADYIYFHSIAALIEHVESILKRILGKNSLKVGQLIVFTHNSLLHDRLSHNFEYRRIILKEDNVSILTSSPKTINNYRLYIEYIARFIKNPRSTRKEKIFIGNMIRRCLEIITNFNDLDSNSFEAQLVDSGKPKLALLANHLSHDSFSKVLNPLNSEQELVTACKELLEVIKEYHPKQYDYIEKSIFKGCIL